MQSAFYLENIMKMILKKDNSNLKGIYIVFAYINDEEVIGMTGKESMAEGIGDTN
ncbi:hypothetical protein [Peribacillus cavernae]|uniref:hypothetical protein n=1 Tax=Peribacillus cavernae TaxID=1674310 RepID=UPI00163B89A2|nr:hypothetical protein [Peribacillus cavernae]MDQ0217671.1 hypothetical protein [Peribacillus cavernae]